MRVVHGLAQVDLTSRSRVTAGVFDGVHRGHRQLISAMVEAARAARDAAVAVTFDPHPAVTLGAAPLPLLTTMDERVELLATLGLGVLVVLPFTLAVAHTPAADFIASLIHHLHLVELWGGPDFALGHRREGDVPFLQRLGAEQGFAMRVVEPLVWEGEQVSSSRVRAALRVGDVRQATGCLGRPYRLSGTVVRERGVGRLMGTPTANLSPAPERLVPAIGVYACLAHTERLGTHPAVVNVGVRPTFAGQTLCTEAHVLDFDADLYGQVLALDFVARLRDERPFPSTDALVEQIKADVAQARCILKKKPGVRQP
jgi:riboflavin kinase/FMN adenylyltransferase